MLFLKFHNEHSMLNSIKNQSVQWVAKLVHVKSGLNLSFSLLTRVLCDIHVKEAYRSAWVIMNGYLLHVIYEHCGTKKGIHHSIFFVFSLFYTIIQQLFPVSVNTNFSELGYWLLVTGWTNCQDNKYRLQGNWPSIFCLHICIYWIFLVSLSLY